MQIKQMNKQIKNGNARIHSFPGATSHHLLHYLDVNLDKYRCQWIIVKHKRYDQKMS